MHNRRRLSMSITKEFKRRDIYLNKLITFQDTEPVKVITGIRRCGKSSLLKLMIYHLIECGISESQIIEMNFESYDFMHMTAGQLYAYVKDRINSDKKIFLFFDEIQRINGWEEVVNAFRVDFNCDIYITGSNAYLLSSEYSTYLSGRCIEIKMLPLSFKEFLYFHNFELKEAPKRLGDNRKVAYDKSGERYELKEIFDNYLRYGGMPGIADVGLNQDTALALLDGIYSTIVMRDILEREKRKGQRQIADPVLLRKIVLFLADNIGNSVSANAIGNTLINEGLLSNKQKTSSPSVHTVQAYINALTESYIFYDVKRFDVKGKDYLRTLGKYYIADIGLRNYLLGFRNRDIGHILENIVYFELLRRGYDAAIGKIDTHEIDFIATNSSGRQYIQVTESMTEPSVRERELTPLLKLRDNYSKIILTLNPGFETDFNGVKVVNLLDWLLEE